MLMQHLSAEVLLLLLLLHLLLFELLSKASSIPLHASILVIFITMMILSF
jgi:hypothetical protein